MPKGSEALNRARRDEIVSACASLYETMGFQDITIGDIADRTSFTRTSIYNYFQTKEEIFLALFQREHEAWTADLEAILREKAPPSAGELADAIARTLEKRSRMLKLESMDLYNIEGRSRMEALVSFKKAYARAREAVARCLERSFPAMSDGDVQGFLYAFFPFLFGVYPYVAPTEKQRRAMDLAGVGYPRLSIYEITRSFLVKALAAYQ